MRGHWKLTESRIGQETVEFLAREIEENVARIRGKRAARMARDERRKRLMNRDADFARAGLRADRRQRREFENILGEDRVRVAPQRSTRVTLKPSRAQHRRAGAAAAVRSSRLRAADDRARRRSQHRVAASPAVVERVAGKRRAGAR